MRVVRRCAALLLVFGLMTGACIPLSLPTRGLGGGSVPAEFAPKLVVGKVPPTELIAEDNSRCITSSGRFDRVRIGSEVWCVWTDGGARNPVHASIRR